MILLGALFVSHSARGHQLVFAYPAQHDAPAFLGLPAAFLSDILSPKIALCDSQFHLVVGDIDFVGLPTLLNADRPGTGLRFSRLIQKRKMARAAALASSCIPTTDATNATSNGNNGGNPVATNNPSLRKHDDDDDDPDPPSPSAATPSFTQIPALHHLNSAHLRMPQADSQPHTHLHHHQLTMFNLVFAMRPDARGASNYAREISAFYHHFITKVTGALKYEQLRRGYIRSETDLILAIKDDEAAAATAPHRHSNYADLQARILRESSLARTIAAVFHAALGQISPHLEINQSVSLSLQTTDILPSGHSWNPLHPQSSPTDPSLTAFATSASAPQRSLQSSPSLHRPTLRPYQALLLLSDPEDILRSLPADASPLLVELIQIVTPMQCFEELQTALGCSLSQIYRLAAHLLFWGKARVIHVISSRNVYIVSPTAQLNNLAALSTEFATRFPHLDLVKILHELSTPRPYSTIAPSRDARNLYLEIITFLLRKDLVVQLHMYLYLVIPAHIVSQTPDTDTHRNEPHDTRPHHNHIDTDTDTDTVVNGSAVVANLARLSRRETAWITAIAQSQPPPFSTLFLRLVPYLDGRVHVEEILHREGMARKELKAVIGRYKDEIVTALYQQP